MSDTEIIIQLLRKVEWRSRAIRLLHELALGVSIVLVLLIALKVWDLFFPLGAIMIASVVAACAFFFVGYVVWRLRTKGTLDQAAASIDDKAGLHDELRTAFWFINNPRSSEWVERQIQRAANNARQIDLDRAYPRLVPRTFYIAAAMTVLFIGLNVVPLPVNHNWLRLQAASQGSPTNKAAPGSVPPLDSERLRNNIRAGLEEIARDLRQSEQLKPIADAILQDQIARAAEELRDLASQMGTATPQATQEMLEGFRKASTNKRPGLEALTQRFGEAAQAMESNDEPAMQESIEQAATELERVEGEMLARVNDPGQGQSAIQVDAPPIGDATPQTKLTELSRTMASDSMGRGTSGRGGQPGPREGPPTTLEVKLQQEILKGIETDLARSQPELEEASKRERATLDYRNVRSELSAAQKDVLNRHKIPWEYRPLIKSYFQAIGTVKK